MADNAAVLTAFRDHLVTRGIVRKPGAGGPAPPMYVEMEQGSVSALDEDLQPADRVAELLITIKAGGDIAPGDAGGQLLQTTIDVSYRAAKDRARLTFATDAAIKGEMIEKPYGFRSDWFMATLKVVTSRVWAGLAPIGRARGQGYEHLAKYYFEVYF